MKLVRYGAIGQEKPGLIDKSGQLRDLSAHVKDLNGEAYAPASLAKLAGLDRQASRRRRQAPARRARDRHVEIRRDRPELYRPCQGNRKSYSGRADLLPEGQHLAVRPQRQCGEAARLDQARLGSRNRRHHRHPRQIRLRGRRAQSRRRLLRLQRRVRAQFPDRALGQWTKGKSHDTFGPVGPWLVTKDEIRTCRNCRCGSTSTASAARPDRPRP